MSQMKSPKYDALRAMREQRYEASLAMAKNVVENPPKMKAKKKSKKRKAVAKKSRRSVA